MKKPLTLFMRIAWMKHYRGVTDDDIPSGAGSHVEQNRDGGEVFNFQSHNGKFFGYARMQSDRNINIDKLGAKAHEQSVGDVTVVFFAKNPATGGQYIIGWYRNAEVFRSTQNLRRDAREGHSSYNVVAYRKDGHLIPEDDRVFDIPHGQGGWPGQTNVWYVPSGKAAFLKKLEEYMADPVSWIDRTRKKRPPLTAFQKDVEKRKQVEISAMTTVADYFSDRGYDVTDVSTQNLGWDMEAKKVSQLFLLEVKGLSGEFGEYQFDVTPNELAKSKTNRKHFRFCVVSNALSKKHKRLEIFYDQHGKWKTVDGKELILSEIRSAKGILRNQGINAHCETVINSIN
jgi:hypothetical protein